MESPQSETSVDRQLELSGLSFRSDDDLMVYPNQLKGKGGNNDGGLKGETAFPSGNSKEETIQLSSTQALRTSNRPSKRWALNRHRGKKTVEISFQSEEEKRKYIMWSAVKVGIGGGLGGLLFGYDLGVVAGALSGIANQFSLSITEKEYVVSMLLVGAIFGSFIAGYIIDWMGRWKAIILNCLVFIWGAFIVGFAKDIYTIYFGRFIVGVGISSGSVADVAFLSEVSPAQYRGTVVTANELLISFGIFLSYLIDYIFQNYKHGWQYMFFFGAILAILQIMFILLLPESPKWLLSQKKYKAAMKSLKLIYGSKDEAKHQASILLKEIMEETSMNSVTSISEMFDKDHENNNIERGMDEDRIDLYETEHEASRTSPSTNVLGYSNSSSDDISSIEYLNDKKKGLSLNEELYDGDDAQSNDKDETINDEFLSRNIPTSTSYKRSSSSSDLSSIFAMMSQSENTSSSSLSSSSSQRIIKKTNSKSTLRSWKRQVLVAVALMILQQISGNINFLSYAPSVFMSAGMNKNTSGTALVLLGIVKTLGVILALLTTDKIGRKPLLIYGTTAMTIGCILVSIGFSQPRSSTSNLSSCDKGESTEVQEENTNLALSGAAILVLIGALIFVIGYSIGYGPISWLVVSEMFPTHLRGKALSIATIVNWLFSLVVSLTFLSYMCTVGEVLAFLTYALTCIAGIISACYLIPETIRKSPLEIYEEMK